MNKLTVNPIYKIKGSEGWTKAWDRNCLLPIPQVSDKVGSDDTSECDLPQLQAELSSVLPNTHGSDWTVLSEASNLTVLSPPREPLNPESSEFVPQLVSMSNQGPSPSTQIVPSLPLTYSPKSVHENTGLL